MEMIGFLGCGISHERSGVPCQDAIGTRACANGSRVYAVADGAGSAQFAAEAAAANVAAVLDYFEKSDLARFAGLAPAQRCEEILNACRQKLDQIRKVELTDWAHLAATLLFFVSDGERWAAGHLGDGILLVQDETGQTQLYSEPENAGRRNATYFTVSPDAAEHMRIYLGVPEQRPARMLMMSDGPCDMFRTRNGSILETAVELLGYVRTGELCTAEDLADALDQMTVYPIDRMDDWSVVIWSTDGSLHGEERVSEQSMLHREEQRTSNESGSETQVEK